ncbi:hypothetical protein D9M72_638070 [compost metagenome]
MQFVECEVDIDDYELVQFLDRVKVEANDQNLGDHVHRLERGNLLDPLPQLHHPPFAISSTKVSPM